LFDWPGENAETTLLANPQHRVNICGKFYFHLLKARVERVVLNALAKVRLCRLIFASSAALFAIVFSRLCKKLRRAKGEADPPLARGMSG
jgi:hypothetical protein